MAAGHAGERADQPRRLGRNRLPLEIPAQIGLQFHGAGIAKGAILFQALRHDRVEVAAESPVDGAEGLRLHLPDHAGHLMHRLAGRIVGGTPCEQLVEHDAEGVDVGPHVDVVRGAIELLRAHVPQCAQKLADVGMHGRQCRVCVGAAGHAEVDDLGLPGGVDEDVAGLEVTVHHALEVPVGHRLAGFADQPHPLPRREATGDRILGDWLGVLDVFHHEVRQRVAEPRQDAHGVDAGDPRMRQPAEDLCFLVESLRGHRRQHAGPQHLHGHGAAGHALQGLVDAAHAPFRDEPDDRHIVEPGADGKVAVVGHRGLWPGEGGQPAEAEAGAVGRLVPPLGAAVIHLDSSRRGGVGSSVAAGRHTRGSS